MSVSESAIQKIILDLNDFAVEAELTAPELVKLAFFIHNYIVPQSVDDVAKQIFDRDPLYYSQHRIQWIKDVRKITNVGLKESKDATERVLPRSAEPNLYAPSRPMWHGLSNPTFDDPPYDEPPF